MVRKHKKQSRIAPYRAGLLMGYGVMLLVALAGGLLLSFTDNPSSVAAVAAIPAIAMGSFIGGRTAGYIRRQDGLRTGAICGALIMLPLLILGLCFGRVGGVMLVVKLVLCLCFGMAGGVVGVNAERR